MEQVQAQPRKKKKWPWIIGGVVLLLVIIGLGSGDETGSASTGIAAKSASAVPPVETTAAKLSAAYQENEAKAQLAYEGKALKVTGVVKDIDLSLGDAPVIKLKGSGDQYDMGVNAKGKMTDVDVHGLTKEVAAELEKGKSRTFECTSVSEVMGSAQLQDCVVK
jgi:hypothetical protein